MIPRVSSGPSQKLRKNETPSHLSFVPYLKPGTLLPKVVQTPPGSLSLEASEKGAFWSLRKPGRTGASVSQFTCARCEQHRKRTGQKSRADLLPPHLICTQALAG